MAARIETLQHLISITDPAHAHARDLLTKQLANTQAELMDTLASRADAVSVCGQGIPPCALIAEDDPVHCTIIGRVAAMAGFRAIEAKTFDEIAGLLRTRSFDCVSLDLGLGPHSGVEVLNLIAQLQLGTPIIIVSGLNAPVRDEAVHIARQNGLNICQVLAKPLSASDLVLAFRAIQAKASARL
jgi:ActR/RegA family two-component response regulator